MPVIMSNQETSEGMEAPAVSPEIHGKLRQFQRVLMSYIDFEQAGSIAHHIIEADLHNDYLRNRSLLQGLNCGMVVAYCRPFAGSKNRDAKSVPDLPGRFLRVLDEDERALHAIVLEDRNTVLAHSDSEAWNMRPVIHRFAGSDVLVPLHHDAHAPLTSEATRQLGRMCDKLREACSQKDVDLNQS